MQADVEKLSPTEVEVRVQVPWERVAKGLDESFKALGKRAKVKGFRPGKVPPKVLRKMFGRQVRGEVTADLVQRCLIEAVTTHSLPVVSEPEMEAPTLTDGEPLSFVAKMQVRPAITPADLSTVEVERVDAEVPDSAVDAAVERLRGEHAELKSVDDERAAQPGDVVTVDYKVALDGEAREDMAAEGRTVELGNESLTGPFEEGLVGAKVGETKTIDLPFEEDDSRTELAGKTATFEVSVKSIQERILPEPDDEFARDVGDFASLLELRLDLRKKLEEEAKRRAEDSERERLVDALVAAHDVPVPPAMIEDEKREMLTSLARIVQGAQLGSEFLSQMTQDLDGRAAKKVQVGLVLGAIAQEAKLEVSDEELEARLQAIAEETGKHVAKVRAEHNGQRREHLKGQLLEEKLFAHLREQVRWQDPVPADKGTADASPENEDAPAKKKPAKRKKPASKKKKGEETSDK